MLFFFTYTFVIHNIQEKIFIVWVVTYEVWVPDLIRSASQNTFAVCVQWVQGYVNLLSGEISMLVLLTRGHWTVICHCQEDNKDILITKIMFELHYLSAL